LTRTPTSAPAYRVNFSHAKHTAKLSCADCHQTRAGAARGRQMSAPQPLMHHAPVGASSCAACHNGRRAFGGDDFTTCTRCHPGPQWHF
jgi:c(7)-type cytochrome triheme protein